MLSNLSRLDCLLAKTYSQIKLTPIWYYRCKNITLRVERGNTLIMLLPCRIAEWFLCYQGAQWTAGKKTADGLSHRTWQLQPVWILEHTSLCTSWINTDEKPSNFPIDIPNTHGRISQGQVTHMVQHLFNSSSNLRGECRMHFSG